MSRFKSLSRAAVITVPFIALCLLLVPYNAWSDTSQYSISPLDLKPDSELPTVRALYGDHVDQPFFFNLSGLNNAGQVSGNFELAVPGRYVGTAPFFRDSDGELVFIDSGIINPTGIATRIDEFGQVLVHGLSPLMAGTIVDSMAVWKNGSFSPIEIPGFGYTNNKAYDLNESGLVIGKTLGNGWVVDRFTGTYHEIFPFNWFSGWYTTVDAINSQGKVVGSSPLYVTSSSGYWTQSTHAFIWDAVNKKTDLGSLGDGSQRSAAYGVNDRDQVVGTSNTGEIYIVPELGYRYSINKAFLWEEGVMMDLGTLDGFQFSEAVGINNEGQIIGNATRYYVSYGYVYSEVVGFFWENASLVPLESLLPEGHGWSRMIPVAINDHGAIVGEGLYGTTYRGFIMSPPGGNLSVAMNDSPDPLILGERLTYSVEVANYGPSGATGVKVTDPLPADTYFISGSAGCMEAGGTVTCDVGSLASGASASLTFVVEPVSAGILGNTATVEGNEVDPDPSNNASFTTTDVLTPAQAVRILQGMILSHNLQQGLNNSLDAKLQVVVNALEAINAGQRQDASNKLGAFVNEVEAQRGHKVTDEQADELIGFAARIIAAL